MFLSFRLWQDVTAVDLMIEEETWSVDGQIESSGMFRQEEGQHTGSGTALDLATSDGCVGVGAHGRLIHEGRWGIFPQESGL